MCNAGRLPLLFVQPQSVSHGLNLQGGSRPHADLVRHHVVVRRL